ncbi:MAG: HEAT repeat domain-containing protein [Myxococcales bacterium]|nr:HEAT repeat domain-containing protein [Myxococcales bacterium]
MTLVPWLARPLTALLLSGAPPSPEKALASALGRLEEKPGDPERLREVLGESRAGGGVTGLLARYTERASAEPKNAAVITIKAHFERESGRCDLAIATYGEAMALGKDPAPLLGRAACELELDRDTEAFESLRRAAELSQGKDKLTVLESLLEAALEAERGDITEEALAALDREAPRDLFLKTRIARHLSDAGRLPEAATVWRTLWTGGDPKLSLLAASELGRVLARSGQTDEAVTVYETTLGRLPSEHPNEPELRAGLVDAYRRAGRIDEYVARLEKTQRTYPELLVLAELLEETGQDRKALDAYRRAVKERPRNTDAQAAVIRILQRVGTGADVEAEYARLAKTHPDDPSYALDLAAELLRVGKSDAGLRLLDGLGKRFSSDPGALSEIGELLIRFDGSGAAIERVYEQLIRLEPNEEAHFVAYGEYWYGKGDTTKATLTWRRVESAMRSPGKAARVLARLYADHELNDEAEAAYRRAVSLEPERVATRKSFAIFLERIKHPADALAVWDEVHSALAPDDAEDRREARRRVVALSQELGRLDAQMTTWRAAPEGNDKSALAARLLLAEALVTRRAYSEAAALLEGAGTGATAEHLLLQDEVYDRLQAPEKSLDVLTRLVALDPSRSAPRLKRMAELALTLGRTADAERLARRVVDLSPSESESHEWLGDVLSARGLAGDAAGAFRKAVSLAPKKMPLRFKLVRTLERLGLDGERERELLAIVAQASDPNDVGEAGRALAHVGDVTSLERLEAMLVRLTTEQPKKSIYRDLLIDLYAALATRIRGGLRSPTPSAGGAPKARTSPDDAHARLQRIGEASLRPILDSMGREGMSIRSKVLQIVTATRNTSLAPTFARLLANKDRGLVFQALVGLAHVYDPAGRATPDAATTVASLEAIATAKDSGLGSTAIWALGRSPSLDAGKALDRLAQAEGLRPDQSFALSLALGARGRRDGVNATLELLRSGDIFSRPAAAWSLGVLGDERAIPALEERVRSEAGPARAAAIWALGAIGSSKAIEPLLRAAWSTPDDASVARWALARCAAGPRGLGPLAEAPASRDGNSTMARPGHVMADAYLALASLDEGRLSYERAFPGLLVTPGLDAVPDGLATGPHAAVVRATLLAALGASDEKSVLWLLQSLLPEGPRGATPSLVLGPMASGQTIPAAWNGAIATAVSRWAAANAPETRAAALMVIGQATHGENAGDGATAALVTGLADSVPRVAAAAAGALAMRKSESATRAVLEATRGKLGETWMGRAAACDALSGAVATSDAARAFVTSMLADPMPTVRAAAGDALATAVRVGQRPPFTSEMSAALERALADRDPSVVRAAAGALKALGVPGHEAMLARLAASPDPVIRDAAR